MKLEATLGEKYDPAMKIIKQSEADAYFKECVRHNLAWHRRKGLAVSRAEVEKIERSNLGYYAGYYNSETRERVERLFKCSHPVFGSVAKNGVPTVREALAAGALLVAGRKKLVAKLFPQ